MWLNKKKERTIMFNFLVGVVFGIIISTIGLSGVANLIDKGVQSTKTVIQETQKN